MGKENLFKGFDPGFIGNKKLRVRLPVMGERHKGNMVSVDEKSGEVIHYINFSLALSASRKFPVYTASNIDGSLFRRVEREDAWRKDPRLGNAQWGYELYGAKKSDFDRGHMTKREDVQWGETEKMAVEAAKSTFYYTNAVPQHSRLNKVIWKNLEDYILHKEANTNKLKISVFTGPVLSASDPTFITPVKGESVRIPVMFWKVVYFTKNDGLLYRVGFLMSQSRLLKEDGIVEETARAPRERQIFLEFEDAETYQVNIPLIEKLADLKLPKATDCYKDSRNIKLVLEKVDIDPDSRSVSIPDGLKYTISNLML